MPKENHTSLIDPDHKLVITINGQPHTLLGRTARLARALINAQHEPVDPDTLMRAMGLQPPPITDYKTRERQVLYKHINQLRKQFPSLLYTLSKSRGWRISRDQHPRIVFDSKVA